METLDDTHAKENGEDGMENIKLDGEVSNPRHLWKLSALKEI